MTSNRLAVIRTLRREANDLRAWADDNLPEIQRVELYFLAARLERTAAEMVAEPAWHRVGADLRASTRAVLDFAQRGLRRRAG